MSKTHLKYILRKLQWCVRLLVSYFSIKNTFCVRSYREYKIIKNYVVMNHTFIMCAKTLLLYIHDTFYNQLAIPSQFDTLIWPAFDSPRPKSSINQTTDDIMRHSTQNVMLDALMVHKPNAILRRFETRLDSPIR